MCFFFQSYEFRTLIFRCVIPVVFSSIYTKKYISFFFVALRPNAGHCLLIQEAARSHTTTHHRR